MAKIAFILLCHKDPDAVIRQARQLTAAGDVMSIHFDASAPRKYWRRIQAALKDDPAITFARRRVKCGWGAWSLVQATLNAIDAAVDAFPRATHFYMISGDCMAIKSAAWAHAQLDATDADHIESFGFFDSDWIKTGIKEDRLVLRHYFNERKNKALFYASIRLQRALKLQRKLPDDLSIMIGSQWWCLRRRTVESILDFLKARPDVLRFFRTTWIPDETFFQTLVRHLVPEPEINCRTLTFLTFTDYGMPATFYNDHYDLLLGQDYLFARKVSPEALELKERLGALYASERMDFRISGEGRQLFAFLTGQGRVGRRFAPRFWDRQGADMRERELLLVVCKKWHVAKRLVGAIRSHTNIPAFDYIFNEASAALPDLGGIQTSLEKRTRHRRALVDMLFAHHETGRLLLCLDSSAFDLIEDFAGDRSITRLLEIDCRFTDAYLTGHARRIGLAGAATSDPALTRLLPTIRADIDFETDRLRNAGLANLGHLREGVSPAENAEPLAQFLSVGQEVARAIAETPHLFSD